MEIESEDFQFCFCLPQQLVSSMHPLFLYPFTDLHHLSSSIYFLLLSLPFQTLNSFQEGTCKRFCEGYEGEFRFSLFLGGLVFETSALWGEKECEVITSFRLQCLWKEEERTWFPLTSLFPHFFPSLFELLLFFSYHLCFSLLSYKGLKWFRTK